MMSKTNVDIYQGMVKELAEIDRYLDELHRIRKNHAMRTLWLLAMYAVVLAVIMVLSNVQYLLSAIGILMFFAIVIGKTYEDFKDDGYL